MRVCPAVEAVQAFFFAFFFQTADSAASSNSQGRSLIRCKMSNEGEVRQVCCFLSQAVFFFLRKVSTANLADLNFPLVCDDAHQIESTYRGLLREAPC